MAMPKLGPLAGVNTNYNDTAKFTRILINGFGAEIGSHHFAGVCALEIDAYRDESVGELVGLYTITRFKGEGVGARLVARALEEARARDLRYVFACTIDERAGIRHFRIRGEVACGDPERSPQLWASAPHWPAGALPNGRRCSWVRCASFPKT
jgi:GNAT superfamily N-acetyltransferase